MIADAMHIDDNVGGQRLNKYALKEGDHRGQWRWAAAKWKVFFSAMLLTGTLLANEPTKESAPGDGWRVWLEPKFMHRAVTMPIANAKRAELVAGQVDNGQDVAFTKQEFEALKVDWADFAARARANADKQLAKLKPEYVRDRQKVIQYAVLSSEEPVVASAVLSSGFLPMFKDTIGDKLLVVVASRYRAFIFPRLASQYQEYAPMAISAYRATSYPVSLEVFEVSAEGWKAVGVYEEP